MLVNPYWTCDSNTVIFSCLWQTPVDVISVWCYRWSCLTMSVCLPWCIDENGSRDLSVDKSQSVSPPPSMCDDHSNLIHLSSSPEWLEEGSSTLKCQLVFIFFSTGGECLNSHTCNHQVIWTNIAVVSVCSSPAFFKRCKWRQYFIVIWSHKGIRRLDLLLPGVFGRIFLQILSHHLAP